MSVYVARIPQGCEEAQLKSIFESVGPVKSLTLKSSKGDHVTNYAFVDFFNEEDAAFAVDYMNNYQVGQYRLLVNIRKRDGVAIGDDTSAFLPGGFKSTADTSSKRGSGIRSRGGFGRHCEGGVRNTGFLRNAFGSSSSSVDETDIEKTGSTSCNEAISEEKVLVVHIEHPARFWGQPVSQENANDLNEIASALAEECRSAAKVTGKLIPAKIYACQFSFDQLWYRCQVEAQASNLGHLQKVQVRYLDYGNCEWVALDSLVELSVSLRQKPQCAKEYKLDVDPVNMDKNSETFKQGVEHLQNLTHEQVVIVTAKQGFNASVKAIIASSDRDIAEEMKSAGFTIATSKKFNENKSGSVSKPCQPLRSPRTGAFLPPANSKEGDESRTAYISMQSELHNSKRLEEKLNADIEMLKQKNVHLEQALSNANSKLEELASSCVSARFSQLFKEVATLKNFRNHVCLKEGLSPVLKNAIQSMTAQEHSAKLKDLSSYSQLLDAEVELSCNQEKIRNCSNRDEVNELVQLRNYSRKVLLEKTNAFLKDVEYLGFDAREQELQGLLSEIEKLGDVSSFGSQNDGIGIIERMQAYEKWRARRFDDDMELQRNANLCSSALINSLEIMKQNLSLIADKAFLGMEYCSDEWKNVDELVDKYSKAVTSEILGIEDSNIEQENRDMTSDVASSLVETITEELHDIKSLRNELKRKYERRKEDIEIWMTNKPDIIKLKETKTHLKNLKSRLRHKQADLRDLEEDSGDDEELGKIEAEIKELRNELHKWFCVESNLLKDLGKLAECYYPELNIMHPDLGIAPYMESNCILHARGLEYFDHHSLPLISSASSQPLVFKTTFNQKDCVLKEFSFDANLLKETFKSRIFEFAKCSHPNLISLDSLFFDKTGRKAYLQTPFYGGATFKSYTESKPSPTDLNEIFSGLLQAVNVLHGNGCVHGFISFDSISIQHNNGDVFPILREPNFSLNESQRFEHLAKSFPILKSNWEIPSKEFDMFCFGLVMFSAYIPGHTYDVHVFTELKKSEENPIYDIIGAFLTEDRSKRLSAFEAMNNPIFQKQNESSKIQSDSLSSAVGGHNGSGAFLHLTEAGEINAREGRGNRTQDLDRNASAEMSENAVDFENDASVREDKKVDLGRDVEEITPEE